MGWDGNGTFTRTNGTNSGSNTWAQDKADGIKVTAARFDTHDQDLATGINACLAKNGENAMTGDLDMGGNTLINYGSKGATVPTISVDTYTPEFQTSNADGTFTYYAQTGSYFELGDFVICQVTLFADVSGSPTGTLQVTLPHTVGSINGSISIGRYEGFDTDKGLYGGVTNSNDYVSIQRVEAATNDTASLNAATEIDSTLVLDFTAIYIKS